MKRHSAIRTRRQLPHPLLLAGVALAALAACCPAPTVAAIADDATVLIGVVGASDGERTLVTDEAGRRYAVRPPLGQATGSVVYLRGRFEGGVFVVADAAAVQERR